MVYSCFMASPKPISAKGWFWRVAAMLLLALLGALLIWSGITYAWLSGFPENAGLKDLYAWLAIGGLWLGAAVLVGAVIVLILSIRRDNAATRAASQHNK